jgi:hypothetical protein
MSRTQLELYGGVSYAPTDKLLLPSQPEIFASDGPLAPVDSNDDVASALSALLDSKDRRISHDAEIYEENPQPQDAESEQGEAGVDAESVPASVSVVIGNGSNAALPTGALIERGQGFAGLSGWKLEQAQIQGNRRHIQLADSVQAADAKPLMRWDEKSSALIPEPRSGDENPMYAEFKTEIHVEMRG